MTATLAAPPEVVVAPARRGRLLVAGLVLSLAVVVVASAALGAYAVSPADVLRAVGGRLGLPSGEVPATVDAVLWQVRFPRIALAVLVGACLGLAGAVMQGVFANPLAEPGTVGVSAGAAVGAVVAIVTGAAALSLAVVPVAAFVGGVVTTLVVHRLARADGRTEVVTLLLTGIGVNALAGAVIGWCTFVSDDAQLRSITFWSLGSVGLATWPTVLAVLPFAVVGVVLAPRLARSLDLLALGDRPAAHLGLDVERVRRRSILLVALLTAAAVAAAGIVGFVGLVVPHLVRLVAGPLHGVLLPASALGGALLVLLADLVGRTAAAPAEIPLGVVTALVGAPVFLWLVRRARREAGGWG
ncbi:MAG: iron ABC transporter permease [Candidatus Nanopelagicales bacterium]